MAQAGYSLVNISNSSEVQSWSSLPNVLDLPNGDQVHCPVLGNSYSGYRLVTRVVVDNPPSQWYEPNGSTIAYDATNARVTETIAYAYMPLAVRQVAMCGVVDMIRNQNSAGGITFNSKPYQTDPDSRENIAGGAQLAALAIAGGVLAGNTKWDGTGADFGWIAADNSIVLMDAQTVVVLGKAAAEFKKNCIMYGYNIKQQINAATTQMALDAINITAGWPTS